MSFTLVDQLVIINNHKYSIFCGIIKTYLIDHCPIFSSVDTFTFSNKLNQHMYKRDLLNFNAENFYEALYKLMLNIFHQNNAINLNNFDVIFNDFIKSCEKLNWQSCTTKTTFSETIQIKTQTMDHSWTINLY